MAEPAAEGAAGDEYSHQLEHEVTIPAASVEAARAAFIQVFSLHCDDKKEKEEEERRRR